MSIKAIIFDFGGVIGEDCYWTWLRANIKNLEEERHYFEEISFAVDCCEISAAEFVRRIALKAGLPDARVESEILGMLTVYPEVKALLSELKPKFKIGLLSNFIFEWLNPVLQKNEIYPLLDVPIISTAVNLRKPDPEIYKLTLERLGVEAHESVFIDDRPYNLVPAEALGMKTLLCGDPSKLRADLLSMLEM